MHKLRSAFLATVLGFGVPVAGHANLVSNGDFSASSGGGGTAIKTLQVAAGNLLSTLTYSTGSNTFSDMEYVLEEFTFIASDVTTSLSFTSEDASSSLWGPVIGGVTVTDVPEPASLTLLGASLGVIRRRRG
jgi:hypothetical protein